MNIQNEEPKQENTDGTIIQFLCGSHSFEGVWFGEKHPNRIGKFWWRKILKEQDKKMYSEEEVLEFANYFGTALKENLKWFKQFKNK